MSPDDRCKGRAATDGDGYHLCVHPAGHVFMPHICHCGYVWPVETELGA